MKAHPSEMVHDSSENKTVVLCFCSHGLRKKDMPEKYHGAPEDCTVCMRCCIAGRGGESLGMAASALRSPVCPFRAIQVL
jgi:hypothetical protein